MSSSHETIEYDRSPSYNVRDLVNTAVHTGTIIEVDHIEDIAKVNISGVGVKENIPIFYHCGDSENVAGGSAVFKEEDQVYVLEKPGTVLPEYIITGFVDGLKECVWEFKLYRDDDTTVRDKSGNITTPSGLSIDLYALDIIYLRVGGTTYGALPGHHGSSSAYWTYDEELGIWTYDDSADYPDDWWKGTYNTNTGYFTINKTMEEPTDRLYWASFFCKDPRAITDPAENVAVSTENIDKWVGMVITLTEAGKAQTLQPPTDIVAGRPFIVKASESNKSYTINVNGITLAAGVSQGFTWDGSAWGVSDVSFMYGLETQYPYKYKLADKLAIEDKISIGSYEANIPYWEVDEVKTFDPALTIIDFYVRCDTFTSPVMYKPHPTVHGREYWQDPFDVYRRIKTSVPYKTSYQAYGLSSDYTAWGYGKQFSSDPCDGNLVCCNFYDCPDSSPRLISLVSYDGTVNRQDSTFNFTDISEWKSPPSSIEIGVKSIVTISNIKLTGFCYICNPEGPALHEYVSANLMFINTRGYCEPGLDGININFNYE